MTLPPPQTWSTGAGATFRQVSYFDFEPETDLTVVEFVPVPDDADDW